MNTKLNMRMLYAKVMAVVAYSRMICIRLPVSVTLVMINPLLKNAAKGGKPLVVIIIIAIKINDIGMVFLSPPIKRMSRVPMA